MRDLILIGAGGLAETVIDSIDYFNYRIAGFIDETKKDELYLGCPILGSSLDEIKNPDKYRFFICIGDNIKRKRWYDELVQRNLKTINIIDKMSWVSKNGSMGECCFVGKGVYICGGYKVGNNCIINTKSLLEHGCIINNHVNISTNATLNGDVIVGNGSFIGSGAVIFGQTTIRDWAIVGAGAVVRKDVPEKNVVAGVPARFIREVDIEQ